MFCDVECVQHVAVPPNELDANGVVPASCVVTRLLKQLSCIKALEELGYFLGVTKLKSVGNGINGDPSKYIFLPVTFTCRTLLPLKGEVMVGTVHSVNNFGAFLNCGPMKWVYLSGRKMPNYHYVDEENPLFLSHDSSRIEKGVVIRFMVYATRWNQKTRDIHVLASLIGDCLGPVSLAGCDGFEF